MTRVLIAGAGIGGLTAALALSRAGARVTVLERSEALAEIGAGLQLSPNATRILARLGLLDDLETRAMRPRGVRVRAARSGRTIAMIPLDRAEARYGAPYLVAHRADVQAVLTAAVDAEPIALHLGTSLAGFGTSANGVVVTARQGRLTRNFEADALIGADGVRSSVREKLVDTADTPQETGRTAWRAQIPWDRVDPALRAPETGLWLGRDAHVVQYPLGADRGLNVVAITRDEGAAADPHDLWAASGDPAVLRSRLVRWHARARALLEAAPSWTTWPLFDRAALAAWNAGPLALLGDAAHPILPFLAQGAAQAIEDAASLAEAFATTRDVVAALARYSNARRARATRVQEEARRLGGIYHLAGPPAVARDLAMGALGGARLLARYDWLYGPRLERT